jgi:hypothetical protein
MPTRVMASLIVVTFRGAFGASVASTTDFSRGL